MKRGFYVAMLLYKLSGNLTLIKHVIPRILDCTSTSKPQYKLLIICLTCTTTRFHLRNKCNIYLLMDYIMLVSQVKSQCTVSKLTR